MQKIKFYLFPSIFLLIIFGFMLGTLFNVFRFSENKHTALFTLTEDTFQKNTVFKQEMITINGAFQKLIGKHYIEDPNPDYAVVSLENGYLSWAYKAPDIAKQIESTIAFNEYLSDLSIPFCVVQMPFKISKYDNQLPQGISDHSNDTADLFVSSLKDKKIPVLDLRDSIQEDNIDHYSLFFKTDHHWKPETALWAAQKTGSFIDYHFDYNIDTTMYNIKNYNFKTYHNWFLGSQGKRIGPIYSGVDDISVITPKFPTNFTFEIPHKSIVKNGSFAETMFDYTLIEKKDLYNLNPYAAYTGGDFPLNVIKNHNSKNTKKILLLRDSFSCTYAPFLSLAAKELHIIDLRYYNNSLKSYIEANDIDLVIMAYNPSAFLNSVQKFQLLNK